MSGPVKAPAIARAIVAARQANPERVPFASGVAPGDDRTAYFNASEAGGCARQAWFRRSAVPGEGEPPHGVFDRGHAGEAWAVAMLGAAGLGTLRYAGADQRRLIDQRSRIAGTPDGLLVDGDCESGVEVKTYGSTVDRSTAPGAENVAQAELCLELFHRTTHHRPVDALLLYLSAEDYGAIHAWRVPRRPAVWIEMQGKALSVLDATRAIDVLPSPGPLCGLCPWRKACSAAELRHLPLGERLRPEDVDRLDGAVQSYLMARAAKRSAEAAEIDARVALKQTLQGLDLARAARPAYVVRLYREVTPRVLDETALAGVLGDLEPYRRPGDPAEKLEVRVR